MIRPTRDFALVSKIIGYEITHEAGATWLVLEDDTKIYGIITLSVWDAYTGIVNAFLIKKHADDRDALKDLAGELTVWIWDNTPFVKVWGLIPTNRNSIVGFFQRGGFKREGVLKDSYYDGENLYDQTIIGISNGTI